MTTPALFVGRTMSHVDIGYRTEDLLNDEGPSPSMSVATKGSAGRDPKTDKGDGLAKEHIAVCLLISPCRFDVQGMDTDSAAKHLDLGQTLLSTREDLFLQVGSHQDGQGSHMDRCPRRDQQEEVEDR